MLHTEETPGGGMQLQLWSEEEEEEEEEEEAFTLSWAPNFNRNLFHLRNEKISERFSTGQNRDSSAGFGEFTSRSGFVEPVTGETKLCS